MAELHSSELVIKHTEVLVKLSEQITSVCRKLDQLEKFIMEQIKQRDKQLETAKEEMDRRLDGMNEIRKQLDEQAKTFISKIETDLRFKDLDTKLAFLLTASSELKGGRKWEDHIIEVVIGIVVILVVYAITHGVK